MITYSINAGGIPITNYYINGMLPKFSFINENNDLVANNRLAIMLGANPDINGWIAVGDALVGKVQYGQQGAVYYDATRNDVCPEFPIQPVVKYENSKFRFTFKFTGMPKYDNSTISYDSTVHTGWDTFDGIFLLTDPTIAAFLKPNNGKYSMRMALVHGSNISISIMMEYVIPGFIASIQGFVNCDDTEFNAWRESLHLLDYIGMANENQFLLKLTLDQMNDSNVYVAGSESWSSITGSRSEILSHMNVTMSSVSSTVYEISSVLTSEDITNIVGAVALILPAPNTDPVLISEDSISDIVDAVTLVLPEIPSFDDSGITAIQADTKTILSYVKKVK